MRRLMVAFCAMSVAGTLACGKSQEQKQAEQKAEQVSKGAEQVQNSAESMAKGLEEMSKGLTAMAGGDPNQKPVDPVSFRELQTAFGDMSGWQKGKPTGERMTSPVNYSEAKVTYTKGEQSIEAQISDSAFNQMLLAPMTMFLSTGYEKETDRGYEKGVKIGEYPGWEKWDTEDKSGELSVVVNKRFIVQLNGRNLGDAKDLHAAMNSVDLKKLAALK